MIQWALASVIAGCKEVFVGIDQKKMPFHFEGWEGYVLANIHRYCMLSEDNSTPKGSPFLPSKGNKFCNDKIRAFMPEDLSQSFGKLSDDLSCFHGFSIDFWKALFPEEDYSTFHIDSSLTNIIENPSVLDENVNKVIMIVGSQGSCPISSESGRIMINDYLYEARVITTLHKAQDQNDNPSNFIGRRYIRHGKGFSKWWFQERRMRGAQCVSQYHSDGGDDFPILPRDALHYITVYVKVDDTVATDRYRLDFH